MWSGGYIFTNDGEEVPAMLVGVKIGTLTMCSDYPTSFTLNNSDIILLHYYEDEIMLC